MKWFIILLLAGNCLAEIVPTTRRVDWTHCGVPGGIPDRTTVFTTVTSSDSAATINSAIDSCPSGQVVAFAAGTYNLTSNTLNLDTNSGITLRGAGMDSTILNFTGSGSACINTDQYTFSGAANIASGYTKGSTSVVMSATPNAQVATGNLICITQADDTDYVFATSAAARRMRFACRVTSVSGNTVNFTPPLPLALTAGLTPQLLYSNFGPGLSLTGIEDLSIVNGDRDYTVYFWGTDRCWLKNVEVSNFSDTAFFIVDSVQTEIRHCHVHDAALAPANPDGYAVYLYGSTGSTSYCLVEDNIFDTMFVAMWQTAASGNAYLYNYCRNGVGQSFSNQLGIMNAGHGAHPMMCLWEGNIGEQWQHDSVHGSASHQTLLRNWIHGLHPTHSTNRKMVDLTRATYYCNIIGNILGDASWSASEYEMTGQPGYSNSVIYRLGYPNGANNSTDSGDVATPFPLISDSSYPDDTTEATLARHGNYDYFSDAQVWETTNTNVTDYTDHTIPDSYFHASKPAYFGGLTWPPFNPASPGSASVADIPAGYRYENAGEDPPAEGEGSGGTVTATTVNATNVNVTQ